MSHSSSNVVSKIRNISEGSLDVRWVKARDSFVPGAASKDTASPVLEGDDVAGGVAGVWASLVTLVRFEKPKSCSTQAKHARGSKSVQVFGKDLDARLDFVALPIIGFDDMRFCWVLGYVSKETRLGEDV